MVETAFLPKCLVLYLRENTVLSTVFAVLRPLNKRSPHRSTYSGVICLFREPWRLPVPGKFIHCFTSFKGGRQTV